MFVLNPFFEKEEDLNMCGNIWKLYVIEMAYDALFMIPIIVLFFQENGLTLHEAFLLQSVFAFTLMIFEIPTGYLSDRWGRKNTIISGSMFGLIGIIVYALSSGFWDFCAAEILLALMVSFHSGTKDAMLYDTLLEINQSGEYMKIIGQKQFLGFMSQAVASILGGFLATVSLRTTVWAELVPFVLGLAVALSLKEPIRHTLQEKQHLKAMWSITVSSLLRNISLRNIMILYGVLSSLTLTLMWFTQPYQTFVGLPIVLFGVTHAIIMMITGLASRFAYYIGRRIDDHTFLLLIGAGVVGSYLCLGIAASLLGLIFLLVGRSMFGFLNPVANTMINKMITSDIRATVLSLQSFGERLLFGAMSPLVGYMADVYTLNLAILMTGIAGGIALVCIFLICNARPLIHD